MSDTSPFAFSFQRPGTTTCIISEQELQEERLHHEILRLLVSRKPNTLHIRQRHSVCICPRSHGSSVAVRYGECKAVLEAVVLDLGVIEEGSQAVGPPPLKERWKMSKGRSGAERKRWLEGVEDRIRRTGRYCRQDVAEDQRNGISDEMLELGARYEDSVKVPRINRRQEPFEERLARTREQRVRGESAEYAAVADEGLLRPGVPPPPRGRLKEVPMQRDQRGRSNGSSRETRTMRSVRSRSTVPVRRSVGSISTAGTHGVFKSFKYMVFGKLYFKRVMATRKGKKRAPEKRSRSANARIGSHEELRPRSRGTTSGLPAEITAGSFGNSPSKAAGNGQSKKWWSTLTRSKPIQISKIAPWAFDLERSKNKDANSAVSVAQYIGCAPGPSSREGALDDVEDPDASFCSSCSPSGVKDKPKIIKSSDAPDSSPPEPKTKTPVPTNKFNTFPPPRNGRSRSSLPRTPEYGTVEPLAPQLRELLAPRDAIPAVSDTSTLKLDNLVVDERAIWIQCSERLDYVSDIAATEAWAKICKARGEATPDSLKTVPSVKVYATETAKKVPMQRVRVQDVDCTNVTTRRHEPRKERNAEAKLNEVSSAAVAHARRPLNTPWEGAWHRDLPKKVSLDRSQTPSGYSVAESVPYSLSSVVCESETGSPPIAGLEASKCLPASQAVDAAILHPLRLNPTTPSPAQTSILSFSPSPMLLPSPTFERPDPTNSSGGSRSSSTAAIIGKKQPITRRALAQRVREFSASATESEDWETANELYRGSTKPLGKIKVGSVAKTAHVVEGSRVKSMEGIVEDSLERLDSALGMHGSEGSGKVKAEGRNETPDGEGKGEAVAP